MIIEEHQFPSDWKLDSIAESFDFTRKPRGLDLAKNGPEIPFFPMDQIPLGRIHVSEFTPKPVAKLGSGTYVENGDLMLAKITPSFENGKQAVVDINTDFAYATTEVIPMRGREEKSDTLFLFPGKCMRNLLTSGRPPTAILSFSASSTFSSRKAKAAPPITPQRTVNRNHPIIIGFSGPNHPISASPCIVTRSESTDNRPTPSAESSAWPFGPSRRSARQNGERNEPGSRTSGHPAVFSAILRDRGSSGDSSLPTGQKRTQIRTWCPDLANAETYRPIAEIVGELKAIEAEARETDKALRKILKQLGI